MARLVVFLDANVLYPADLRSFLMYLAVSGLIQARWSDQVHEEWISSLLENRPDLTRGQLERTRELMDKNAIDSLVTGFEHLMPSLDLPDKNDRHVLAAAIHCKASVIVTRNLKDFPLDSLKPFGLAPQHPDELILRLIEEAPERVCEAAETHRLSLKNPPKTVSKYLEALELQGIPKSVAALRRMPEAQ